MVSTHDNDAISRAVFGRVANGAGGQALYARSWEKQVEAFAAVRADIGSFYTVTYQPRGNEGPGFRKIAVEVVSDIGRKLRIRSRSGYRVR